MQTVSAAPLLQQYVDDGYTIVSGAVPPDLCARAEDAVWRALRLDRDRPGDWPEGSYQEGSILRTPEFSACITPAVDQAIDALLGARRYIWGFAGKETAPTPILSLPQKTPSVWNHTRPMWTSGSRSTFPWTRSTGGCADAAFPRPGSAGGTRAPLRPSRFRC